MLVKLILVSIVLVAIVMAAMGIRLLLDKNAEMKHSCGGADCGCDTDRNKSCNH
ncbi:MAG: hypothetical protein HOD63_10195 [Bacteroidetes bacterium]|jgi:hypothetical protein|nr:hypothetical protein [Bacteroidota bacterium]MBT5527769.1 hypothetical protein [Cytophagia bacterium]MBT3421501.1 hypothetical protein [Bacteroidota bacterium]MBT3800856.1 hypothetical protein [Bacteroidota bacterium]MBT3935614.1 hypothetical protein [Bacteroidota bacterium]